jgi:ribulose-phosphate 3-epimerase
VRVPEILPSLLAADFTRLGEQIAQVESGGATKLHFDVMDGHFVPSLSMGPPVLASIRKRTRSFIDVHLMIEDPDRYLSAFADAGASSLLVHQEVCPHLHRTLEAIKNLGLHAGVVINPATPIATLTEVLSIVDSVLVMSVNPGFGGQDFIPHSLTKVVALRSQGSFIIEMDGGIGPENVEACVRAGADWLVAGTSIFGNADPGATFREMTRLARDAASVRV